MDSYISEFRHIYYYKLEVQLQINNRMTNSDDPDEKASYDSSHLNLHCLLPYMYWYVGMKVLTIHSHFPLLVRS